jgi:hypothetical protein
MLDSSPAGINQKPVEVLDVHISAAVMQVACKVRQQPPATQSLTGFNSSRYKPQAPGAYMFMCVK